MLVKTKTPPLGWNSYDSYGIYINEKEALENLEAFVAKLKPHGYEYFCIDAGWYSEYLSRLEPEAGHGKDDVINRIDEYGRFVASPRLFPHGLRWLADKIHAAGLKFGIHIMRGIPRVAVERNTPVKGAPGIRARDIANVEDTCCWCPYLYGVDMAKPGAQEYYDSVIEYLAGEGVDFVKADDIVSYLDEIDAVASAIERNQRPIVLSLSPGNFAARVNAKRYQRASTLRVTSDVWDRDDCIERCLDRWETWAPFAKKGFFIDLDMIPFGALQVNSAAGKTGDVALSGEGLARLSKFDLPRKRTFITMQALAASPLIMGGSLSLSPDEDIALVTNPHVLACDRNGVCGRNVLYDDFIDVRKTPDAKTDGAGWLGVFNRHHTRKAVRIPFEAIGFEKGRGPGRLKSLWDSRELDGASGALDLEIAANDAAFIRYEGA